MMRIFSLLAILASISNAQTQWAGSYTLQGGCPAACAGCCTTTVTVAQSGTSLSSTAGTLGPAGTCGAFPAITGTLASGTATTVILNLGGVGTASAVLSGNSIVSTAGACTQVVTRAVSGGTPVAVTVYTDNSCQTLASNGAGSVTIASGSSCGTIAAGGILLTGSASISGNTITLQSCACASETQCGATSGTATSFTNNACNLASAFVVGGTGSVRLSWVASASAVFSGLAVIALLVASLL